MPDIYHITCIENLNKIIQTKGLLSYNELIQTTIGYTNIAHKTIQDRRSQIHVPCGPGGNLHDYIPFYFAPRSPMLYTIYKGNVEQYKAGQNEIAYLVSDTDIVSTHKLPFVFTDGHAIMDITEYFDDLSFIGEIDWTIMSDKYWANTAQDNDRKRRRSAEFLVQATFPWNAIKEIAVMDKDKQHQVNSILTAYTFTIPLPAVNVRPGWYY